MERLTVDFLIKLRENNNRNWFNENKSAYEDALKEYKASATQVIEQLSLIDPELMGLDIRDCLFRIYRDIRFSHDKTPYKNHFGAYLAKGGRKSMRAGYYFHIEPGNSFLGGGIWKPDSKLLKHIRHDIVDNIEEFEEIIEKKSFNQYYSEFSGDRLKRNPVGFSPEFRRIDLIKLKQYSVVCPVSDELLLSNNWIEQVIQRYKEITPLCKFLNYGIDAFLEED